MVRILSLIFEIIGIILGQVLDLIFQGIAAIIPGKRKTAFDADFISASELLGNDKGFCLNGIKSLSIEESFSNALVLGGTGSGKSSRILIPSILKMGHSSLVIHDPSGELFEKTSGALHQEGYIIKTINYAKPEISEGYNPMHRALASSDIKKVSQLIVHTTLGVSKDPYWNISAMSLISFFLTYTNTYAPLQFRNLYNVLYLINTFSGSPEKIDQLIVATHDDALMAEYKSFVAYDNKMLMSIVATARAALSIFSDQSVAKVTSFDTIDFNEFRIKKVALFINNSVSDMKYYTVISSLFFEQFWSAIMNQRQGKDALPIFFLLDECSALSLNSLPITVSNIRKYKAGILQVYQHYGQIVDMYGTAQARNIAANCYGKCYLKGQPIEVAQELETTLGKFQFDDDGIQRTRPLLAANEIRQLDEAIILIGNKPPIKTKMTPYYKQRKLNKLASLPPYTIDSKLPFENPPLIQLTDAQE